MAPDVLRDQAEYTQIETVVTSEVNETDAEPKDLADEEDQKEKQHWRWHPGNWKGGGYSWLALLVKLVVEQTELPRLLPSRAMAEWHCSRYSI